MKGKRHEQTRRQLLDVAKEAFATRGYTRTSHADIAFSAGIARTTFYEYFSSKEDLLVQLVEEDLPAVIDEILTSIPAELPAEQRLAELTSQMVEFVATDHLGLILHTEVPRLSDEAQYRIARAHSQLAEEFVAIYREGVAENRLRSLPPAIAGRLIEETVMTAGRALMAMDDPKQQVHEVSAAVADFLIHGLAARED